MEAYHQLVFEKIKEEDVPKMSEMMKRAFDEDTRIHLGKPCGGPPGYDNGEFIKKWYLNSGAEAFKIIQNNTIIGGFNVFISKNKENYLGNIFVDPSCQNRGCGTVIWKFIEQKYPDTIKWSTETPGFSKRNHNFYVNKCGFKIIRIDHPKNTLEESYVMEKEMAIVKQLCN